MNVETFVTLALSKVGEKEDPPHSNRGAFIEQCQRAVGIAPGLPWCSCFACWCLREANGGSYPSWFVASASGLRLYEKNKALQAPRGQSPQRGDIVVWSHGHGLSHVGIVDEVISASDAGWPGRMHVVAGNTTNGRNYCDPAEDRKASREGDQVGTNIYPLDDSRILGYLRPLWVTP